MSTLAPSAMSTVSRLSLLPCSGRACSVVSAMLASLSLGGHPREGRSSGTPPGIPDPGAYAARSRPLGRRGPRAGAPGRGPTSGPPLRRRVPHDVEARARVPGIPGARGRVVDGHLTALARHDDRRREPLRLAGGHGEAVVLDEQRLPAPVDDRLEDV